MIRYLALWLSLGLPSCYIMELAALLGYYLLGKIMKGFAFGECLLYSRLFRWLEVSGRIWRLC